jgi:hypothetical protein
MLRPAALLRLYPRRWRERYGDEFIATVGHDKLRALQVIDIVMGAIDAWLSADVRHATAGAPVAPNGGPMTLKSMLVCQRTNSRFTTRDSLIGAGVMIGGAAIFSMLGLAARRDGMRVIGEILINVGFLGSLTLSMPFWLMKGQPWKAQVVIVGTTLALLVAIGYLGSR